MDVPLQEPIQNEITKQNQHSQHNQPKKELPNHRKIGENYPPQPQAVLQPQPVFQPQAAIQPQHFMTENEQLKWALEQSRLEEPMQIEITKKQNQLSQPNLPKGQLISKCPFGQCVP